MSHSEISGIHGLTCACEVFRCLTECRPPTQMLRGLVQFSLFEVERLSPDGSTQDIPFEGAIIIKLKITGRIRGAQEQS
jgi:hypothetical protein